MDNELFQFFLVLTPLVIVPIGFLAVDFKVCHEFTGAWNGLRFMLDMRYWAMCIGRCYC